MSFNISKKGNKAIEERIDKDMRKDDIRNKVLSDYELFAYDVGSRLIEHVFYINKEENTIIYSRGLEIVHGPVKIEVKEGTDPITAYINHISRLNCGKSKIYKNVNLTLVSRVYKYLLENYDANCPLQFDNIGQMGDPESLFAGEDACENLERLFETSLD